MYFLCHDSDTIFSELIGKLPIITVNISFKNVSHNSQYICNCYLDMYMFIS